MDVDHKVQLEAFTQPAPGRECKTAEQLLAFFARVSNTANQGNHKSGPRLIASLIKRKEWSPLDMVNVVVEIQSTRDIGRQILRHWSIKPQEFSQRYSLVESPPIFTEARKQDANDRQASIVWDDPQIQLEWKATQQLVWNQAVGAYMHWVGRGMAKEVARKLLPEGLTPTLMYMNGTLRSWIHYCALRASRKTQKEHAWIACQIWNILLDVYPSCLPNLTEIEPDAYSMSEMVQWQSDVVQNS